MQIERTWVLNKSHIRRKTSEGLVSGFEHSDGTRRLILYTIPYEYGWIVAVPEDETEETLREEEVPEEFIRILKRAGLANVHWIRLDADAPIDERMPTFDWDPTPMTELTEQLSEEK